MSDHEEYFFEMLALAERYGRWKKTHRERYLIGGLESAAPSRFQRKWEETHGRRALRFELAKRGG